MLGEGRIRGSLPNHPVNYLGNHLLRFSTLSLAIFLLGCSAADLAFVDATPTLAPSLVFVPQPTGTAAPADTLTARPDLSGSATPSPTMQPSSPTPTSSPISSPTPSPTPAVCNKPGQMISGKHPSQIAGPERSYRIYLPPCYGEDGLVYPTLYVFHGNASNDNQWDELGLDDAAEQAILDQRMPPFIIVMPDGGFLANNTSGGPWSFEGMVMNELIPHIEANYCAWPSSEGRAIGGLSRGGYWALEIAFRNASAFASVGAHSAALIDSYAGPDLNPQYTGLTADLGNLRIYMDTGNEDWYIANFRRLHEDLETAGRPHTWVLNEGRHEDAYWADHVPDYVSWYTEPWPAERSAYPPCILGGLE